MRRVFTEQFRWGISRLTGCNFNDTIILKCVLTPTTFQWLIYQHHRVQEDLFPFTLNILYWLFEVTKKEEEGREGGRGRERGGGRGGRWNIPVKNNEITGIHSNGAKLCFN